MKALVNEEAFKSYLEKTLNSKRPRQDCLSRCRRVELCEGNLYNHYTNDRGKSLLERLSYSKEDADRGVEPNHNLEIKGEKGFISILEGTRSYRNAVTLFFEFLRQHN